MRKWLFGFFLSALALIVSVSLIPWNSSSGSAPTTEIPSAASLASSAGPQTALQEPKGASPLAGSDPALRAFVEASPDAKSKPTRIDTDFTSQVTNLTSTAEFDAVVSVLRNPNDEDTARNEAANLLRRTHYEKLDDELIALLDNLGETPRIRFFFIQHLGNGLEKADASLVDKIERRLRTALGDRDLFVRREALRVLAMRNDQEALALVAIPISDQRQAGVKDLIIRLSVDLHVERLSEIRVCLHDEDEKVRVAAIAALATLRDTDSRSNLESIAKAKSSSHREKRAAEMALERLSTDGF